MTAHGRDFILRHTRLQSTPLLPELPLYLADEVMPIWQILEEEQEGGAPPPLWASAWVGGQAVARYVLDHRDGVAGRHVLDFAAGSGLCAIAAVMAGATFVQAADIDTLAGEALALNAQVHGVTVEFTGRDLLVRDPPEVDLILAGDVCYEQPMAARALAWLRSAHVRGIRVLLGDPNREHFPREKMTLLAEYEVPTTRELEGVERKRAGVYTFDVRPGYHRERPNNS